MSHKTITIKLYVSELLYDIERTTHLTADSKEGKTPEQIATIKAGDDDLGRNTLLRSIGSAYATLVNHLSEYISMSETQASNIQLEETPYLELTINRLPSNYNEATVQALAAGAHQYIVYFALMEWLIITSPSDAGDYAKLATSALDQLRTAINRRVRPHRPTVRQA